MTKISEGRIAHQGTAIRERLAAIGIDTEGYSGHSLRAGFATSAAMLSRYVRGDELFVGNAASALLRTPFDCQMTSRSD